MSIVQSEFMGIEIKEAEAYQRLKAERAELDALRRVAAAAKKLAPLVERSTVEWVALKDALDALEAKR